MWASPDPFDDYALAHMASAAGDALVAIALADSVFFSLPIGQARLRVALYLALTMAPLAVAAPVLVPLLDRGRFRRAISFGAAAGRAVAVLYAAPRAGTLLLFPATFVVLVLSKVHSVAKNGLIAAYASAEGGLVSSNARLGRVAVAGVAMAAIPGSVLLILGGSSAVLYLGAAVYAVAALLNLQLERHVVEPVPPDRWPRRGRMPELAQAAVGTACLRAGQGFLLFLMAFGLRASGRPTYWLGALVLAGIAGGLVGDLVAPRLPAGAREETVVLGALVGAGAGALLASQLLTLPTLALFSALTGMATEFGRLAFGSLMQRTAPAGAHGRVFVRYEVAFQLSWVVGALVPAMFAAPFSLGILALGAFDLVLGGTYLLRPWLRAARPDATGRSR